MFYSYLKLAGGFERIRTEHSILVWDIRGLSASPTAKFECNTETVIYNTISQNSGNQTLTVANNASVNKLPFNLSSFAHLTTSINTGSSSQSSLAASQATSGINQASKTLPDQKPIYETGSSETCNSLSWNQHDENLLLTGINGKSLKIFDIRGI